MKDSKKNIIMKQRRQFLKGIGTLALSPLLPMSALAERENNATSPTDEKHRVMSCNIRVALPEDEQNGVGWPQRKKICIDIIKKYQPDIICLQEVLKIQSEDFRTAFPDFQLLGFDGPEMDAHTEGYHGIAKNPILFSQKKYELLSAGTFWLSETPLVAGSKSWETARARHANWIRLKDKRSSKEFRVVNLHLDHVSEKAKIEQAKMVAMESAQYLPAFPQILAGDFNARAGSQVFHSVFENGWSDSYTTLYGPKPVPFTTHSFKGEQHEKGRSDGRIDFIFCKGKIKPLASSIIKDHVNGKYPSDHYFLYADMEM